MTLRLERGTASDPVALQSLLNVATAFVAEQLADHGAEAYCDPWPFQYTLGEGIELTVWSFVNPLTWSQLSTILRGLRLYLINGHRPRSYYFEVHDSDTLDVYTQIGWGDIGNPGQTLSSPRPEVVLSAPSNSTPRRALRTTSLGSIPGRAFFRIPRSHLILELLPKGLVQPNRIKALLLSAQSWITSMISIFGESGPAPSIFDYPMGNKIYARFLAYSAPHIQMSWGQIESVVDGLWTFVVEKDNPLYTYCQIYDTLVSEVARIGYAVIIAMGSTVEMPLIGIATSNLTAKRAVQIAPAAIQLIQNVSDPTVYV